MVTSETPTKSAKEYTKLAHDLRREGKLSESKRCFTRAFQLFMDEGMEDEAAGILVQLADIHKRLGRTEQSAEHYKRAADIYEKLGRDEATFAYLRTASKIYKKLGMDEKVAPLKKRIMKRINKLRAMRQSIKIEKKAIQKAKKQANESLRKGIITKEYFNRMQKSLDTSLKEIDQKIKEIARVRDAEGERKAPSSYVISELQTRISELSVKMASLEMGLSSYELERKTPSSTRFIFLKVLCSILLFVSGVFIVLYCHILFPLSIDAFLALVALFFSILSFIVVAIWKV